MNWVAAYRKQHGVSQSELARRLDVSRSLICLFEQGKRKPGVELLPRLVQLGIDIATVRPDLAKHLRKLTQGS